MKIPAHQLAKQLQQKILPIYFITGDEPLLKQEAVDAIKHALRQQGVDHFESHAVTAQSDTSQLLSQSDNLSLFSTQQCLLLDCTAGFNAKVTALFKTLAETPITDTFYIIHGPKLTAAQGRSKWYQQLEKHGSHIAVWPIETHRYPDWLNQRARAMQLQLEREALLCLAENTEGNLLAGVQTLQKLCLRDSPRIDKAAVNEELIHQSQHTVFQLEESILSRDLSRSAQIIQQLRRSQTEPTLVIWALSQAFRLLAQLHENAQTPINHRFKTLGIWPKRQPAFQAGLRHYPLPICLSKLQHLAHLDKLSKGLAPGDFWQTLLADLIKKQ